MFLSALDLKYDVQSTLQVAMVSAYSRRDVEGVIRPRRLQDRMNWYEPPNQFVGIAGRFLHRSGARYRPSRCLA